MNSNTETTSTVAMGLNGVTSVALALVSAYISYFCIANGIILFSFHPILMSTGYLILMFQAILSMSNLNCWTSNLTHKQRVTLHWVLQTTALTFITIAFIIIFLNKIKLGKAHFQTTHAIFGLFTYLLTIGVSCGGVWTKYSFQLRTYMKPVIAKISHSLMGVVTFCMAAITISLGIYSKWFSVVSTKEMQFICVSVLALSTLYVIFKPMQLCFKRIMSTFRASL
uniref:ascorbate ferrireductase (transmembrane) n=1 Tax=Culicoides sonorensis TaxID=179676 RepID=A0A336MAZ1_CULSO